MRGSIHVPPAHREVLRQLASLSQDDFARLRLALDDGELRASLGELRRRVLEIAFESGTVDADSLLEALLGASSAGTRTSRDESELAAAIASDPRLGKDDDIDREILTSRLADLIGGESVRVVAKGMDVANEHSAVYIRSRLVTDIRPAYSGSDTTAPAAAVLTHTLRIDIQENGQRKSLYIGLDQHDLHDLQEKLRREAAKTEGLEKLVREWGLPLVALRESELESSDSDREPET